VAGEQFVQDDAQGVDVGAGVDLGGVACDLLGAHVGDGADDLADVGLDGGGALIGTGDASHTEIEDLGAALRIDEDVGGLEVAVAYTSSATAISADGSVLCISAYTQTSPWVFRWTASGGFEPIAEWTYPTGMSSDGSVVIFSDGAEGFASPDGSVILGSSNFELGGGAEVAWIDGVPRPALDYLQERGADLTGWTELGTCTFTPDMRVFVGNGTAPDGMPQGWVVTLPGPCYANCDGSTTPPILNVADCVCFQSLFAAGNAAANCDGSTTPPILNVADFVCFQQAFAAGCP
jgi:hypothetical protein